MQPTASSQQGKAELGTMERRTEIHNVDYCAPWEGSATACDGRDPPARLGRSQMRIEYAEGYHDHQKLCRAKHYTTKCSQLQRKQEICCGLGIGGNTR